MCCVVVVLCCCVVVLLCVVCQSQAAGVYQHLVALHHDRWALASPEPAAVVEELMKDGQSLSAACTHSESVSERIHSSYRTASRSGLSPSSRTSTVLSRNRHTSGKSPVAHLIVRMWSPRNKRPLWPAPAKETTASRCSPSAMREQGRNRTGIASLPHVKLSPMSAPGPTGEWQAALYLPSSGRLQRRRRWHPNVPAVHLLAPEHSWALEHSCSKLSAMVG